jgi:hypothetical protein
METFLSKSSRNLKLNKNKNERSLELAPGGIKGS